LTPRRATTRWRAAAIVCQRSPVEVGTVPSATNAANATHAASAAALDRAILRTATGSTAGPTAAATASCDAGFRPVSGGAGVADPENASTGRKE
jgi:hypothetical protein